MQTSQKWYRMHKQLTKGRKNSKEIFLSYKDRLNVFFYWNSRLKTASPEVFLFFFLFQKIGSVGRWETEHCIGMAKSKSLSFIRQEVLFKISLLYFLPSADCLCLRYQICDVCKHHLQVYNIFPNSILAYWIYDWKKI